MALPDDLPISESLAVFFGVAGFQWLSAGRAELIDSLLPALIVGATLFIARRWRDRKRREDKS
jgi:predicted transporter